MYIKRLVYFIYYLKDLDKKKFMRFLTAAKNSSSKSRFYICWDVVLSSFKYNISILDYFYFNFITLDDQERNKWAGTGYMYEYQLLMNPKEAREVLENKIVFLNQYNVFTKRLFADFSELTTNNSLLVKFLGNQSGRVVLKGSRGQVGSEVEVLNCAEYTPQKLLQTMKIKGYDLIEEYVIQHPALMQLSSTGLNTIRIFTQIQDGKVDFLGARLRVSVNSTVDNMAAGNLAAPVDIETGIVNGPGVFSDITKTDAFIHPVTQQPISGFQVPHWGKVIELAKQAAILYPQNKSVGWDIAITSDGPELIEGNHNWCKLLWQLPVKAGLKEELEKYL